MSFKQLCEPANQSSINACADDCSDTDAFDMREEEETHEQGNDTACDIISRFEHMNLDVKPGGDFRNE